MKRSFHSVVPLLAAITVSLSSAGCSRDVPSGEGAFSNELKGGAPRAPIAKGGIADDGIKPAPIAKGGVADDGVKPVPIAKGGVADDGVKPVPIAKGGIPDDSIKPRVVPAPLPTPAPR